MQIKKRSKSYWEQQQKAESFFLNEFPFFFDMSELVFESFSDYPVILIDPEAIGIFGSSLYSFLGRDIIIQKYLPDKAILLLSTDTKFCTTYSEKIGGLTLAGICYGGLNDINNRNDIDQGYFKIIPVSSEKFPIENYKLSSVNALHKLSSLGGGSCWSGKYLVAHFIEGLLMKNLYHNDADMVSIGMPSMDTSEAYLPHTHYKLR